MGEIGQTLSRIVGAAAVLSGEQADPKLQEQISLAINPAAATVPPVECIVYPSTQAELAAVMACACRQRWRVLPCGMGSKLDWGGLAAGADLVVSTARLNRLVDHAVGDLTVTAEAGMGFADLQSVLKAKGQFLALDPTWPETATLGGIVATADAGSLRQRYGGVRDMLLGLSFVRADGQMAKAGGRVVKNVAGYDLMKLLTGSYGTLSIISQVTFRVYPLPDASATVVLVGEGDAIATLTQTLLSSALTPVAVDLLSSQLVSALELGSGLGLAIQFQSVAESVQEQSKRLLELAQSLSLQSNLYSAAEETALWKRLKQQIHSATPGSTIRCKIGVLPTEAVTSLQQLDRDFPQAALGLIHAGSGLGCLQLQAEGTQAAKIMALRSHLQTKGGFLSVLQAPSYLKQQLDIWGYSGNALPLMQKIKQKFDPQVLLRPKRFVNGI